MTGRLRGSLAPEPVGIREYGPLSLVSLCSGQRGLAGFVPRDPATVMRGLTTTMPIEFAYVLIVLLVITSVMLTMLILLHKGKGGGMSSMFGGGVSTSLAGSSVAEKNLDRYTVLTGIVWLACIVGLGLWLKVAMNTGV